jgi:hypothetical protein
LYNARQADPAFGMACDSLYEVRAAQEFGTRAELVQALREASEHLKGAADRLERDTRAWFSGLRGIVEGPLPDGVLARIARELESEAPLMSRPPLGSSDAL